MDNIQNLKEETLNYLSAMGKTWADVKFIQIGDVRVANKDKFLESMDFEYDAGYGTAYIPEIMIVGEGWWLERWEYDGSEGWAFKSLPIPSEKVKDLRVELVKDEFGGTEIELVGGKQEEPAQDDGKVLTVEVCSYNLDDIVQIVCSLPDLTFCLKDGSVKKQKVSDFYDHCPNPDGFIRVSSGGYREESHLFRADLVQITGGGDTFRFVIPGFEEYSYKCCLCGARYDCDWEDLSLPEDTHKILRERGYGNLVDLAEADDNFYDHSLYANTELDALWVNFPMEGESRKDQLCVSRFQLSQILFLKSSKEEEEEKRLTLYFRDGSQRSTETGLDLDIGALNCPFVSFGKEDANEAFWARPEDIVLRGPDHKISVSLRDGTVLVEITPETVSPYLRASLGFMRLAEKNSPKWELVRTGFDRYGILDMPVEDHHLLFRGNRISVRDMDVVMFYGLDLGGENTFVHMFSLRKGADKWKDLGTERRENLVRLFLNKGNPELRESFLRKIGAACVRLKDNICEVYVLYNPKRFSGVTETLKWSSRFSDDCKLRLEGENPVEIRTWPIE